jgi:tRNA A37 methylthiotransferase MiaB
MNILFVYSLHSQNFARPLRTWVDVPLGLSYLCSVATLHGHRTRVVSLSSVRSVEQNCERIERAIAEFQPGLIGFSAVATQYPFILRIASHVRQNHKRAFLLIGGVHATLNPEQVMAGPFDAVCVGEGEYPTLELADMLDSGGKPSRIANLWLRNGEKAGPRPFLENLDELPFPHREMWRPWIETPQMREAAILLGRGCPHDCTYCSNHALRRVASGRYVRMRSPSNIASEIRHLLSEYPCMKLVYFEVETIAANKPWLFRLCDELKRLNSTVLHAPAYSTNLRISPTSLDDMVFRSLAAANFWAIDVGLESGSERIRTQVLRRNYTNADFLKAAELTHKYGMKLRVYNMLGLPGETHTDHMETVRLNLLAKADEDFTGIFFPYPGTDLYERCRARGLIGAEEQCYDFRHERGRAFLDMPEYPAKQVETDLAWLPYRLYGGRKRLLMALARSVLAHMPALRPYARVVRRIFDHLQGRRCASA